MGDHTKIEWVVALAKQRGAIPATLNVFDGCSRASEGCRNCYAAFLVHHRMSASIPDRYAGLTEIAADGVPRFNGTVRLAERALLKPLRDKKPRVYFINDMSDTFHSSVPDEWLDRLFAVMALRPQHLFLVLTKRAKRMREYFAARRRGDPWAEAADSIADMMGWEYHPTVLEPRDIPLPNVWFGVTVEDQPSADERIPDLLATPAAKRFVSCEPLLGAVDLTRLPLEDGFFDSLSAHHWIEENGYSSSVDGPMETIDWVIVGGESGPNARPMHFDWMLSLCDQCEAADVPFFFKQLQGAGRRGRNRAVSSDSKADRTDVLVSQPSKTFPWGGDT